MRVCIERGAAALVFSLLLPLAPGQDPGASQQQTTPSSSGQSSSSGSANGTEIGNPGEPEGPHYVAPPAPGGRGGRAGPPGFVFHSAEAQRRMDQQENMKDATALALLSVRLKREIEESNGMVLSLETVRRTDEIEKLVKRIHARLVHN